MIVPLVLTIFILGCSSAPTGEGPVKIGLSLDAINPGLVDIANKHIGALSDTVSQKASAINNLVETSGDTISPIYKAVSETFNTGVNTAKDGFDTVTKSVSDGLTAVSGQVKDKLTAAGKALNDQVEAAGSVVNHQIEIVGSITSQGQDLAQNAVSGITDSLNQKSAAITGIIEQASKSLIPKEGVFSDRPRKIENAILEQEDLFSQVQSKKENIKGLFSGFFQSQPIVDTIKEEDKYGNTGDQFASIGKLLVGTTEGLAKFFSNAINIPFDAFKQVTRSASDKLNNLGARLIGL